MGLSDYWKSNRGRQDAAEQFLQTGRSPDESFFIFGASSNTDTSSSSQECFDSSDCASGWACNGGKCKQSDTGAGDDSYGDTSGCGGGDGGGGGGGGCGASTGSSSSGCTKSGCGGNDGGGGNGGGGDCCGGERCCRYNGSSVSCSCGNCPPPPGNCSRFCTDYSAANGEPAPGCGDGNTCSECEACREDPETGIDKCLPRDGGPCYCQNSSCSGKCATCTEEGTCEDDCANCQTCYTTFKECDCGTVKKTCCYSACDQTKGYTECRESIDCGEECGDPPGGGGGGGGGGDPCAGNCRTVMTCTPDEPPPCPPRSSCTGGGGISTGGQTCTLTEVCDKSNVPDSCGGCDCNCHNDCPECQICNAGGKCEPDPTCDRYFYEYVWKKQICMLGFNWSIAQPPENRCVLGSCPGQSHGGVTVLRTNNAGKFPEESPGLSLGSPTTTPHVCQNKGCPDISVPDFVSQEVLLYGAPTGESVLLTNTVCPGFSYESIGIRYYEAGVVVGRGETPSEAQQDAASQLPPEGF